MRRVRYHLLLPTCPQPEQNDTFRQLFDDVADTTSTLVDNLVLSHSGRRIYSSSTPQGLHMWAEAELGKQLPVIPVVVLTVS